MSIKPRLPIIRPSTGLVPFPAPTTPSNYGSCYLLNNSFTSSVISNNFTVWSNCGNHSLTASSVSMDPGATITI
jgi:hypothetical protein